MRLNKNNTFININTNNIYITIFISLLIIFYVDLKYNYPFYIYIFIALAVGISTFIEEIGTLVFKLLSGYEFSYIRFYKLILIKTNGKFCFKIISPKDWGYKTFSVPPSPFNRPKLNFFLQYSGNIANLIFSIFFLFLYLTTLHNNTRMFFLILSSTNFFTVVFNIVILLVFKADKFDYSMWGFLHIHHKALNGVRYKNMPSEWFPIPQDNNLNNNIQVGNAVYTFFRKLDEFNFKEAGEIGSYMITQTNVLNQKLISLIISELTFIDIIEGTYTTNIHMYFKNNINHLLTDSSLPAFTYRQLYAYELLVNNNELAANKYLYCFNNVVKKCPCPGEAEMELELISYIQQKHHEKMQNT